MEKLIGRSKLFVRKNASTILTCVGGVGVVATTVMAIKATPKAMRLIEAAEAEKGEKLTAMETIQTTALTYAPTVVTGIATLGCIFGANILNKRTQASLVSAYALLDQRFKEYKNKVDEIYGDGTDAGITEEIVKDKRVNIEDADEDDKILFYDEFSGRYFHSTMMEILRVESAVNKILSECSGVYLNDVYEMLEMPAVDYGDHLGWSAPEMFEMYWSSWLDFYMKKFKFDDGLECYILTFGFEPSPDFGQY